MSFRKLLVPLAGVDGDLAAIDAALVLGHEFQARIEALHARTALGYSDPMEAGRVRALFSSRCKYYGIEELGNQATDRMSARFLERQGMEADLIAEHGRLSDLIVFAHPHSTDLPWPNISVQSALRESARPVLLMPNTVTQVGKRNIIAWNGSLEAVRAVTFAIPILARGENTLVVTVGKHDVQPSGEKVVEYLNCHGIEAESKIVPLEEFGKLDIALGFTDLRGGSDHSRRIYPLSHGASRIWFNEYRNDQTEQDPEYLWHIRADRSVGHVGATERGMAEAIKDRLVLASSSDDFVAQQTPAISHAAWIQPSSDATTCWSM